MKSPASMVVAFACALVACSPAMMATDSGVATDARDSANLDVATDATTEFDGASTEAAVDASAVDSATPPCVERNTPAQVMARDGFVEVCADPARHPRAVCGDGSPYRFSYRRSRGASAGLLVYFRGGGNCTDYVTCWGVDGQGGAGRTVGTLSNQQTSAEVLPSLMRTFGIFDQVDPTALFADFDILYVPYCSGDGGLQSTEQTFARPPQANPAAPAMITTYFRGIDNRRAVLQWASSQFGSPSRLVVWGSSAGSYSSMAAIPEIVDGWPSARDVTWWGEGGVGVGRPAFGTTVDETVARFDGQAGRRLVRFVQFSYASDAEQVRFAPPPYFGDEPMFRGELRRVLEARAARAPNNYRYVAVPGRCHTLALEPSLYQDFERVGGRWQPVMPVARPNPELVFNSVSLVSLMRLVTRGSGPFDASFSNVAPDWSMASDRCEIVRGDML